MRALIARSDAARFVGRVAELARVEALLADGGDSRILYVWGPGGIGKSALLRAAGRRAVALGYHLTATDARSFSADLAATVRDLACGPARTCLVIDEVDILGPAIEALREGLLDQLPEQTRLVLAGRRPPGAGWRDGGLDAIAQTLRLGPLAQREAATLLDLLAPGLESAAELVEWAEGSPLALTIAADGSRANRLLGPAAWEQHVTHWIAGQGAFDVPREVLEAAALARRVDARLLAAALPGQPTREGFRRLCASPLVDQVGDTVAVHSVLAAAIRGRLRAHEPDRCAEMTRRIATHLATRATLGEMAALLRLSELIESPELRRAYGNAPSDSHYVDVLGADELRRFAWRHGFASGPDWSEVEAWLHAERVRTFVVRRLDGTAVMVAGFTAAEQQPTDGPIGTSLADAARLTEADRQRSFLGVVLFADGNGTDAAEAARLGSGAMMLQHGVPDLQSILIHYPEPDRRPPTPGAFTRLVDGVELRPVAITDFRPLGAVGAVEAMVLAENGGGSSRHRGPDLLADSFDGERIAQLRARLDVVFGPSAQDQRLRTAIELVHLDLRASEEECLARLNVSRRTWFRLLRTARERVAT